MVLRSLTGSIRPLFPHRSGWSPSRCRRYRRCRRARYAPTAVARASADIARHDTPYPTRSAGRGVAQFSLVGVLPHLGDVHPPPSRAPPESGTASEISIVRALVISSQRAATAARPRPDHAARPRSEDARNHRATNADRQPVSGETGEVRQTATQLSLCYSVTEPPLTSRNRSDDGSDRPERVSLHLRPRWRRLPLQPVSPSWSGRRSDGRRGQCTAKYPR